MTAAGRSRRRGERAGGRPTTRIAIAAHYLRPHRLQAVVLCLLVLADIVLTTGNPLIAAEFIDRAGTDAAAGPLARLAGIYLLVGFANQLLELAAGRLAIDLAQRTTNDLRVDLTDHVLQLDVDYLTRHPQGDLLERVDGDPTTLERFFAHFVFDVVATALLAVGVITVTLLTDLRLGLVLLGAGVLSVWAVLVAQRVARPVLRAERGARSRLTGFVQERLAVREEIRSSSAEDYTLAALSRPLTRLRSSMTRAGAGLRASSSALELSVAVAMAAVLSVGGLLLEGDTIALGVVFLVYQYVAILSVALFRLSLRLGDLAAASGSASRIVDLLSLPTPARTGWETLAHRPPDIALRNVTFSYDGSPPALVDVSLEVPAGSSIALVGASGSGKSTISKLLWRAYEVRQGEVLIGGRPISRLQLESLRRTVGVVSQDVYVFHASIRDNVTMRDDEVPAQSVEAALEAVGLRAWVASLEDGISTQLAGGGSGLSTGQMHLLAIARVLVRDPQVVIMDEVTAHLDPATERLVHQAMRRLMTGRTAVVITHQNLILEEVDQVAVIDGGRVAWCGARESLPADLVEPLVKGQAE